MSTELKRLMSNEEYCSQKEPRCPYCYSTQIEGGSIQIDGSTAWQPITCLDCEKMWNDIYTITAYEPAE